MIGPHSQHDLLCCHTRYCPLVLPVTKHNLLNMATAAPKCMQLLLLPFPAMLLGMAFLPVSCYFAALLQIRAERVPRLASASRQCREVYPRLRQDVAALRHIHLNQFDISKHDRWGYRLPMSHCRDVCT